MHTHAQGTKKTKINLYFVIHLMLLLNFHGSTSVYSLHSVMNLISPQSCDGDSRMGQGRNGGERIWKNTWGWMTSWCYGNYKWRTVARMGCKQTRN